MLRVDIDAFYADQVSLDPQKYLVLKYYFEALVDPREATAQLSGKFHRTVEQGEGG